MQYSDIITRELNLLSLEKQAVVLDFILFLKEKKVCVLDNPKPKTIEGIDAFFRNHQVDMSNFKFDREEANAR